MRRLKEAEPKGIAVMVAASGRASEA
jgi:hypothetical protein